MLLTPSNARGQAATATTAVAATVTVQPDSPTDWFVLETFHAVPSSGSSRDTTAFMYLARPCVDVREAAIVTGGDVVPLVAEARGPWRMLRDTSQRDQGAARAQGFAIQFRMRVEGSAFALPLIVPTLPLPRGADGRNGAVRISVTLPDSLGAVTYPRFARDAEPRHFVGHFPALPSTVQIRLTNAAQPCGDRLAAGDDGGLTWRFWLLVAILATWVPTYQWWARRQQDGDR